MPDISRVALFGKLNRLGYRAIESATVFCKLRGNPYVELVHWIHQILQLQDSDLHRIIKTFGIDPARLAKDTIEALDRLPAGATSISDLSAHVEETVERGWVYGSLMFKESQVRTGHLIVGILKTPGLRNALSAISREFDKVKIETLCERFGEIVGGSPEDAMGAQDGSQMGGGAAPGEASDAIAPASMGKQEALKRFTVDLTEQARTGKLDPIVGRDDGDPPDRRHPHAPPPEQPHPDRRGRRGQDRRGRGLRAQDRRGRRAAAAQGRDPARAGRGPAAGRRQHEGRVRAAAALGDRGGPGVARSRSSCSSTRPIPWSARAARPAPAMRPTCSSRRWRAAPCARSRPPPGPSTRSTSRRIRR